jgi:hypothetical protein
MLGYLFMFFIVPQINSECLIENCETCSELDSSICINCLSGFTRNKHLGCQRIKNFTESFFKRLYTIENCKKYSVLECEVCEEGYKVYRNRCSPICQENCSCFEPHDCFRDRRLSGCPIGCHTCNSDGTYCMECFSGYWLSNENCYQCPGACLSCSSSTYCDVCIPSFFSNNGSCEKCSDHCSSCDYMNYCYSCDQSTFEQNGSCYPCSLNCKICTSSDTCTECYNGYVLSNAQCVCAHSNDYMYEGSCYICPGQCASCTSSDNCITCYSDSPPVNGNCSPASIINQNTSFIIIACLFGSILLCLGS